MEKVDKVRKLEFKFTNQDGVEQTVVVEEKRIIDYYLGGMWYVRSILENFGAILKLSGINKPVTVTIKNLYEREVGIHDTLDAVCLNCFEGDKKLFDFERKVGYGVSSCIVNFGDSTVEFRATDYESPGEKFTCKYYDRDESSDICSVKYVKEFEGVNFVLESDREESIKIDIGDKSAVFVPLEDFFKSLVIRSTNSSDDLKNQIVNLHEQIMQIISFYGIQANFKLSLKGNFSNSSSLERPLTIDIEYKVGRLESISVRKSNPLEEITLDGQGSGYHYRKDVRYTPYRYEWLSLYGMVEIVNGRFSLKHTDNMFGPVFLAGYEDTDERYSQEAKAYKFIDEFMDIRDALQKSDRGLNRH